MPEENNVVNEPKGEISNYANDLGSRVFNGAFNTNTLIASGIIGALAALGANYFASERKLDLESDEDRRKRIRNSTIMAGLLGGLGTIGMGAGLAALKTDPNPDLNVVEQANKFIGATVGDVIDNPYMSGLAAFAGGAAGYNVSKPVSNALSTIARKQTHKALMKGKITPSQAKARFAKAKNLKNLGKSKMVKWPLAILGAWGGVEAANAEY